MTSNCFTEARYGLFIHYGICSLLERGESAWNRERIPLEGNIGEDIERVKRAAHRDRHSLRGIEPSTPRRQC